jgi:hypothetical protein
MDRVCPGDLPRGAEEAQGQTQRFRQLIPEFYTLTPATTEKQILRRLENLARADKKGVPRAHFAISYRMRTVDPLRPFRPLPLAGVQATTSAGSLGLAAASTTALTGVQLTTSAGSFAISADHGSKGR